MAVATTKPGALEAPANRSRPVDLTKEGRGHRIERVRGEPIVLDRDAPLGGARFRDFLTTPHGNIVHERTAAEIDRVATRRPLGATDAEAVLSQRAVIQLHESPDRLFGHRVDPLVQVTESPQLAFGVVEDVVPPAHELQSGVPRQLEPLPPRIGPA